MLYEFRTDMKAHEIVDLVWPIHDPENAHYVKWMIKHIAKHKKARTRFEEEMDLDDWWLPRECNSDSFDYVYPRSFFMETQK